MALIAINEAFHRLVKDGNTAEQAWKRLTAALMSGALKLWCNGNPVALDYVVAHLRFVVDDGKLVVMPAGPLGWDKPAGDFIFEVDSVEFELLGRRRVGRPSKVTAEQVEMARREGVNQKAFASKIGVDPRTLRRKKRTK